MLRKSTSEISTSGLVTPFVIHAVNILRKPSPHTPLRDDAPDDGLVFTLGTSFAHAVCQFAAQMPLEGRRGVKATSLEGPVYVCDGCVMGV